MKQITILLADDHMLIREGLRSLLSMDKHFKVVGEAADGLQAISMACSLKPEVVVLDIAMPKLNGLETAKRILQQPSAPKILMLSAHADDIYIDQVAAMGAVGYLVKQTSASFLIKAIKEIVKGKVFFSPSIASRKKQEMKKSLYYAGKKHKGNIPLTSREREVLQLVAEGRSNKEVASDLNISIKTVEKHRHNLMAKLDLHDTAGITRYAISAGIIESSVQCTIID